MSIKAHKRIRDKLLEANKLLAELEKADIIDRIAISEIERKIDSLEFELHASFNSLPYDERAFLIQEWNTLQMANDT